MKICFPVQEDAGMSSRVYNHFGSAPFFVIVDTAANSILTVANRDRLHAHGACNPLKALDEQKVDAVVVGGIGAGALGRLAQAGVRVYRAAGVSISDNLAMLRTEQLSEYSMNHCCGGHAKGSGCSH